ncbi:MAG: hypothetical protein ACOVP1_04085 [Bacteroidia bacterium]
MFQLVKTILITSLTFILTLFLIKVLVFKEELNTNTLMEVFWKGILFGIVYGAFRYMRSKKLNQ